MSAGLDMLKTLKIGICNTKHLDHLHRSPGIIRIILSLSKHHESRSPKRSVYLLKTTNPGCASRVVFIHGMLWTSAVPSKSVPGFSGKTDDFQHWWSYTNYVLHGTRLRSEDQNQSSPPIPKVPSHLSDDSKTPMSSGLPPPTTGFGRASQSAHLCSCSPNHQKGWHKISIRFLLAKMWFRNFLVVSSARSLPCQCEMLKKFS